MRVALAILCIGATAFLLRFLAALVEEKVTSPRSTARVHFAKFRPSQQLGELIEMSPPQTRDFPARSRQRKAL
jgi:hypothetical protein